MTQSRPLPVAPPPVPADVGLVAALWIEVGPLLAKLKNVRKYANGRQTIVEGLLGEKIVAAIVGGPGVKAARKATGLLLAGHRPKWVLSAGFGGALDPSLKLGDLVFPTEVLDRDGPRYAIDVSLGPDPSGRTSTGRLVTVAEIIRTAAEKAALREATGAVVVDMETAGVAAVCQERNVRLMAVRVISDEAGTDLPPEVLAILGRSGGYRVGAALGAIWNRPSSLKDLLGLRDSARKAADRLASVLPEVIARLP